MKQTVQHSELEVAMLQNNIGLDVKTKCIEQKINPHQVAEDWQ